MDARTCKLVFSAVDLLALWRKIGFKSRSPSTRANTYKCHTIIADTHRQTLYCSLCSRSIKMSSTGVNWMVRVINISLEVQNGYTPILLCKTSRTLRRSSRGGTGGFLGLLGLPCTEVLPVDFVIAGSSSTYGAISMRATERTLT